MIFFTLQCACAESTSGGIKVDRILILWRAITKRIKKLQHPTAVIAVKIDNVAIDDDVVEAGILYISLYLGVVFISTVLLTTLGVDSLSAFSASAATMGNVGPGFGTVGSMGNFSQIPEVGKWLLTATMLLGRLEIFGLILFLGVKSWK
jgi:trk system potassium uptake protein TrkH